MNERYEAEAVLEFQELQASGGDFNRLCNPLEDKTWRCPGDEDQFWERKGGSGWDSSQGSGQRCTKHFQQYSRPRMPLMPGSGISGVPSLHQAKCRGDLLWDGRNPFPSDLMMPKCLLCLVMSPNQRHPPRQASPWLSIKTKSHGRKPLRSMNVNDARGNAYRRKRSASVRSLNANRRSLKKRRNSNFRGRWHSSKGN